MNIPLDALRVGGFGYLLLDGREVAAPVVYDAARINHNDVLDAHHLQYLAAGDAARARTAEHDLDLAELFIHHAQRVYHRRQDDYGCAVLVVVKHGDAYVLQALFHLKALGRGDVF